VLGDEFSFERARALAAAVASWARAEHPGATLLVAHDTRFLAARAAEEVASAAVAEGVSVLRAEGPLPTPVACRAVVRRRCAGALVVTASHNPAEYLGIKVIGKGGACVPRAVVARLERDANARLGGRRGGRAPPGRSRRVRILEPYLDELADRLERSALARSRLEVVYDAFHGTGAGVLDRLLERCGVRVTVRRGDPDPSFGGDSPDPTHERLAPLASAVRRAPACRLGLATDGDGDRFAAVDVGGRRLGESEALALLVDHLAVSRRVRGALALSRAAGALAARVAESHGLQVVRPGNGFAPLSALLAEGGATLAGDESGGFAWAPFAREKDGILAAALLAERAAMQRVPLIESVRALERRVGRSACGRTALLASPDLAAAVARITAAPPARFDGARIRAVDAEDGLRFELDDGGFVLLRASGTEPLLRVHAEAPSAAALRRRLRAARRLLARALRTG